MKGYVAFAAIAGSLLHYPAYAQGSPSDAAALQNALERLELLEREGRELRQVIERLRASQSAQPAPATPPPAAAPSVPDKPELYVSETQSTPSDWCVLTRTSQRDLIFSANRFTRECLGLDSWKTFDSTDLAIDLAGSNDGTTVEIVPSYTLRWGPPATDPKAGGYRTKYLQIRGGVGAVIDSNDKKSATFANLSKFQTPSGLTAIFGFEAGVSRIMPYDTVAATVGEALGKAQEDCIRFYQSKPTVTQDPDSVLALCSGSGLMKWMKDGSRAGDYYKSVVTPIWGSGRDPYFFAGFEGRYSESTYKFFPLSDPAGTGIPLLTALPSDFPGGAQQFKDKNLYSFRLFAGRATGKQRFGRSEEKGIPIFEAADFSGSLTYRRDFVFPDDTAGQQVCAPHEVRILCHKVNIAPPYELKGFVAGARAAFKLPRFLFLPSTGLEIRTTYDFEIDRYGVEVPFYFISGKDGGPNGGVQLSCASTGNARNEVKFEGGCSAGIFFGTEFKLDRR